MKLFDVLPLKKAWFFHMVPNLVVWMLVFGVGLAYATSVSANKSAENFKITTKTLEKLKAANLPQPFLEALTPLLNELYTSKVHFLQSLNNIQSPPLQKKHIDLIVKQALLDNLWIDFDKAEVDFKTGESILTGHVRGGIPKEHIIFTADEVRIATEGPQRFDKIVAEGNVWLQQNGFDITTDRAVYNRETQLMELLGNIIIQQEEGMTLYGAIASLDQKKESLEVQGNPRLNQKMRVEYAPQIPENAALLAKPPPSIVKAQRAVLDQKNKKAIFEGNVEMTRPQHQLYLSGGKISLFFNDKQKLIASHAEQNVCVEQPGRAARADQAKVNETQQSILLNGNAEISKGGIYLAGPKINLFLDVEKGEVVGDSTTPVQMVIPLDEEEGDAQPSSESQRFTCR